MLKIIFLLLSFSYSIYAANNQNDTLLNDQLKAMNRQLNTDTTELDELDQNYKYNQNAKYLEGDEYRRKKFYVGIAYFIGTFESTGSPDHDVKDNSDIFSFKAGYIFPTNNRIEIEFFQEQNLDYPTIYDDISGIRANMIITIDAINKSKTIFPMFKGGVGMFDYTSYGLTGIGGRAGVGLIGYVSPSIEVDVGYSYEFIIWDDSSKVEGKSDVDTTTFIGFFYGVKYKF